MALEYFLSSLVLLSGCTVIETVFPATSSAFAGLSFKQLLIKDDFYPSQRNVKFTVSLDGLPDLPTWLKLEQKNGMDEAILYGTPDESHVGTVKLEVIAWNKDTYETKRSVSLLTVVEMKGSDVVAHQLEFQIKNKDLSDILLTDFSNTVKKVWPNADYLTVVEKPSERNDGNYPLPGAKEGVFVTVGGNTPIPSDLKILQTICTSVPSENTVSKVFSDAGYDVNWCSLKEVIHDGKPIVNPDTAFLPSDAYHTAPLNTRSFNDRPQYLTTDIVFIFIPLAIGLSLIVTLTCSLCFSRDRSTRHGVLKHRPVANGNQTPYSYGQLDDENADSRSGTPYRSNPNVNDVEKGNKPPAYRKPPKSTTWKDSKL